MIKHTAIKAGIGLGLMATSLAAVADPHSFGIPTIYYKVNGAAVNYAAMIPNGNQATSSVIMLDVLQSSTISTWAYAVGGALGSPNSLATATNSFASYSNLAGGVAWKASGTISHLTPVGSTSTIASSSFYGGDTNTLSLSFTQQVTASSQACNMTFSAQMNTDDYLVFSNVTIQPNGWPTATDNVSYRTKSGTLATDTVLIASNVFNAYNGTTTSSFYTFSAWSVPNAAGGAGNTVAASSITNFNKCYVGANARTATNSAGNTIGGKGGLMRLW